MQNCATDVKFKQEVDDAVHDLMNGRSKDHITEWLQREYVRLMFRECRTRSFAERSDLQNTKNIATDYVNTSENRST